MSKTGWKRISYGGYYKEMPNGDTLRIERSMDDPKYWYSSGRLYSYLSEAKTFVEEEFWENERLWREWQILIQNAKG